MRFRTLLAIAALAGVTIPAGVTPSATALTPGSSSTAPAVTDSLGQTIRRLIVAYEDGVPTQSAPNRATGAELISGVELRPGRLIGAGMRVVTLSRAVSAAEAQRIVETLTADPRIRWAEPDRLVRPLVDQPISQSVDLVLRSATRNVTSPDAFRYVEPGAVVVSSLTPAVGLISGGTTVTVAGSGLAGVTGVTVGTIAAPIVSQTDTALTFRTPAGSRGNVTVIFTAPNGNATATFRYLSSLDRPTVTAVSPLRGSSLGGTVVTLTGTNLDTVTAVDFGGAAATVQARTSTSLRVLTSAHSAGAVTVTVTNPAGSVARANGYTFADLPRITSLSSTAGPIRGGATVTVWGNFLATTSSVRFGGTAATIVSRSATSVTVRTPAKAAGPVTVDVTTSLGQDSRTAAYTYVSPPTISAVSPGSGSTGGGVSITVSGTNLALTSRVIIGGKLASIQSRSASSVTVAAPALLAGSYSLSVSTPGGSVTRLGAFTTSTAIAGTTPVASAAASTPTVSAATASLSLETVSPTTGTVYGGTLLTLTGSALDTVTGASVGGVDAVIVSQSATSLTLRTPAFSFMRPTEARFTQNTMWGLTGTYGVRAPAAWTRTAGAPNVTVAVIDTGLVSHSDQGRIVAGYDMVSDPLLSNDGDGRDADAADPGDWVSSRLSQLSGGSCPVGSSSWHGTHVAGIIAAAANGFGVVGVAPNVSVQPVRALGSCGGYTSDISDAILWAAGLTVPGAPQNPTPAKVINMSLGGAGVCDAATQTAINAAVGRGVTVVVAAGNDGVNASTVAPANCRNIIVVGATDQNGRRASFSNFGANVDVSAPGVAIWSTVNMGATTPTTDGYVAYSGTSMAAPHVSAIVALMLSRDSTLSPAQIETRLKATARPFGAASCDADVSKLCGAGIVDARLAVP